jgi:hypothetical protein
LFGGAVFTYKHKKEGMSLLEEPTEGKTIGRNCETASTPIKKFYHE